MTRTNIALIEHVENAQADAKAVESHVNQLLLWPHWPVNLEDITAALIRRWMIHAESKLELSPSTIGTRLSVLKQAMARAGVAFPYGVKMPPRSKRPKWVISEEQQARLVGDLLGTLCVTEAEEFVNLPWDHRRQMAHYIQFVTETGLRVEEALRVTPGAVMSINGAAFLEVLGTKTAASYDVIPLSNLALAIIETRGSATAAPIFTLPYEKLHELWDLCRGYLKITDETATLKCLRRTFASRKAAMGCPAPILQKLMRHGSLATTSHYTNTIGMNEAARQWVA